MEYFTGRFQGHIPITTTYSKELAIYYDPAAAEVIATLMNCIFGGDRWQVNNLTGEKKPSFFIFRP